MLPGPEPLEVVRHLVARCGPQALMRRYRLPAFDGPEGLVQVGSPCGRLQ